MVPDFTSTLSIYGVPGGARRALAAELTSPDSELASDQAMFVRVYARQLWRSSPAKSRNRTNAPGNPTCPVFPPVRSIDILGLFLRDDR